MPERLRRLEETFERTPIYFVTSCTANRRQLLATPDIHSCFKAFSEFAPRHAAWVGAYVLMPDHLHLFVAFDDHRANLSDWMKALKGALSANLRAAKKQSPY
jgi:REP-associated tyrosine transposase